MRTLLVIFILAVSLSSCNQKTSAKVTNLSPNQKVHITITGTRPTAVDAWKVLIAVKAYDFKEGRLQFEIYADDLTEQNVKFDWKDDRHCLITITQREGKPRSFQLIADSQQVQLGEI